MSTNKQKHNHVKRVRTFAQWAAILGVVSLSHGVWAGDEDSRATGLFSYPRGGYERTGYYPQVGSVDKPVTLWIDDLGSDTGTPVIAGDRLLVGNRTGALIALNAATGEVLWTHLEHGWDMMVGPVVVDELILCASSRGVTAHALADGSVKWRKEIQGGANESSPLVVGELVMVGGSDGFAYALDRRTGREIWKADIVKDAPPDPAGFDGAKARIGTDRARPVTAASNGKSVFLSIFDQSRVVAMDLKTGKPKWDFQAKGWISGVPTVGEGKVFVGSQDHKIYALDEATGKPVWEFATKWRADGELAYCEGSVFCSASDGRCYRIDARTGRKIWEYETPVGPDKKHFFLSRAPLVDKANVYFGSWDGNLYALDRKDGTLKWKLPPHDQGEHVGAPITDGKRLFVPLSPLFDYDKQKAKEGVHGIAAIGSANDVLQAEVKP
jgi:glucose dehydrogenase